MRFSRANGCGSIFFSGLKGIEIDKWCIGFVEDRVLTLIVEEYRHEAGLPANVRPLPQELARLLHGAIFGSVSI
jgi:hypothetical protein